jgi:hypothetical protein
MKETCKASGMVTAPKGEMFSLDIIDVCGDRGAQFVF